MCEIFASQPQDSYEPITRNIRLNGQSTSIRLERSFWAIIDAMAEEEGVSTPTFLSTLHSEVLEIHGEAKNFTSLLRCSCVKKMQLITLNPSSNLFVRSAETNEQLKTTSTRKLTFTSTRTTTRYAKPQKTNARPRFGGCSLS